jgi:4-diphosphocytidyl-2-C-methyl-D-erythritol kinase
MVQKSYTRVTLSLDIIRKLDAGPFKGYHELGIIKHQIDLHDTIALENSTKMEIKCDSPLVPCDSSNICWKAVDLIKNEYHIDKFVSIYLQKNIPVMGGLAGGSANGATVLLMLNEFWDLGLGVEKLMSLGRKLGMDVPFYFYGGTVFDTEATGLIESTSTNVSMAFVLAVPEFGVSTKDAYQGLDYSNLGANTAKTCFMKDALAKGDQNSVLQLMHNDFEYSVFCQYPRLREIKQELLDLGCLQAVMTGSGSTILGVAKNFDAALKIQQSARFKTIVASTLKK